MACPAQSLGPIQITGSECVEEGLLDDILGDERPSQLNAECSRQGRLSRGRDACDDDHHVLIHLKIMAAEIVHSTRSAPRSRRSGAHSKQYALQCESPGDLVAGIERVGLCPSRALGCRGRVGLGRDVDLHRTDHRRGFPGGPHWRLCWRSRFWVRHLRSHSVATEQAPLAIDTSVSTTLTRRPGALSQRRWSLVG